MSRRIVIETLALFEFHTSGTALVEVNQESSGRAFRDERAEDVDKEVVDKKVVDKEVAEVAEEGETVVKDCCCWGVSTFWSLCAAESPPPTPPPIAAPNTTSTSTNAIQNVRVKSPQMRGDAEGN